MAVAKPAPRSAAKVPPKPEELWQPARLIPTTGIGGQDEQEQRATSSLLAVIKAVPQFGRAITAHLGAPAGRIETYTEVRFQDADNKTVIPDGAIVVERGKTRWVCLVEVKTGGAPLQAGQIERYLDIAKVHGFDALLTISNQIASSPTESPVAVDARKLKRVSLYHISWWRVMTIARVWHQHRGIADTDQAWILGELIAYLDHERAGAGGFEDMGASWVAVRDGARQLTLRAPDKDVRDVASRWEQFVQYLALGLCQDLGRDVDPVWPRNLDVGARRDLIVRNLVESGRLEATVRVPDAAAPIDLAADLRTRLFTTSVELAAPRDGRPRTRVSWLLRQLRDTNDALRIDARYPNVKESVTVMLKDAREQPDRLLYAQDPKREPRAFRVSLSRELGTKRGKNQGSFVNESKKQALDFYREVVQGLRAWSPSAPRLPEQSADSSPLASPDPPSFGDGERDFGEATQPEG